MSPRAFSYIGYGVCKDDAHQNDSAKWLDRPPLDLSAPRPAQSWWPGSQRFDRNQEVHGNQLAFLPSRPMHKSHTVEKTCENPSISNVWKHAPWSQTLFCQAVQQNVHLQPTCPCPDSTYLYLQPKPSYFSGLWIMHLSM